MSKLVCFIDLINDYNKIKKHFGKKDDCFTIIEKAKAIKDFLIMREDEKEKILKLLQTINYQMLLAYVFKGKI